MTLATRWSWGFRWVSCCDQAGARSHTSALDIARPDHASLAARVSASCHQAAPHLHSAEFVPADERQLS